MKTQELIGLLAQGAESVRPAVRKHLLRAGLLGTVACALLLGLWGVNPHMNEMAAQPVFATKMVWLFLLMGWSAYGLQRLARPGVRARSSWVGLGLSVLLMVVLGLAQWLQSPADVRMGQWLGHSWNSCALSIAALALPVLLCLLWGLRQLAPTSPVWAGAAAGALAGSIAASVYSLHCTETGFAFFATWYVTGMAAVTLLGATLGSRFLRW